MIFNLTPDETMHKKIFVHAVNILPIPCDSRVPFLPLHHAPSYNMITQIIGLLVHTGRHLNIVSRCVSCFTEEGECGL